MAIGISPTSAKGDILSFDGSSRSRVAVGTNGQILTARSSATSGMQFETVATSSPVFELIATTTLTASTATVTFSSIAASYKWLKIIGNLTSNTTNGAQPTLVPNTNSTLTTYYHQRYRNGVSTTAIWGNSSNGYVLNYVGHTGNGQVLEIDIAKNTTTNHETTILSRLVDNSYDNSAIRWTNTTAQVLLSAELTSIRFRNISTDTFGSGSSFHLYGRKV